MDDQGVAAAYLEALRQVGEFKTITVRPPAPVHKGDRITINLTNGRTYTGTVTSCVQIDGLTYDLTAEWDRGQS